MRLKLSEKFFKHVKAKEYSMEFSQKMKYLIYFLITLAVIILTLFDFSHSNQFMTIFIGVAGVLITVYYTRRLKGNSTLKSQYRGAATLSLIVVFLSAMIFVYYPTVFGVTAFIAVYFLLLGSFMFMEWHEKKKKEFLVSTS